MKHIAKPKNELGECIEPPKFKRWKEINEATLEADYENNNAEKAWGRLPSSLPNQMEEDIYYYSKKCLANALLEEQGFLCCYCNRKIHDDDNQRVINYNDDKDEALKNNDRKWSIEHVRAKSDDVRNNTFDYCNLAASCKGGERVPKSIATYCNNGRGNKPIYINPFMENCEELIYFAVDGGICIEDGNENIKDTIIEVLNLNYSKFKEDRAIIIKNYYYRNYEDYKIALELGLETPKLELISKEMANNIISNLSNKDENGHYEEFCSAVVSVLKRDIIEI